MRWLELSIQAPGEYAEPLTHLFTRHGEGRVAVEKPGGWNPDEGEPPPLSSPVVIRAYLPIDPTTANRRAMIDAGVRLISVLQPLPEIAERVVSEEEWANQSFAPVRVGKRLVVAPPGTDPALSPEDIVVPLEPGLAFGTGQHPTTAMCLAALESAIDEGDRFLDVGSGSGILSIAAIALGAGEAVCLDVEDDAIKSTNSNLADAGFAGRATIIKGSVPNEAVAPGTFNVAAANISANALIELWPHLLEALASGGVLIASGVLLEHADEVRAALEAAGGRVASRQVEGDWVMFQVGRE